MDKLIEQVVREVINEYGGVSDTIMEMSTYIFNEICRQQSNCRAMLLPNEGQFDGEQIYFKRFWLEYGGELIDIANEIVVDLYLYDPNTVSYGDFCEYIRGIGKMALSFSPKFKRIRLTFAWPKDGNIGSIERYDMMSSINHEVKHAYQSAKRGGENFITQQYANANVEKAKPLGYYKDADTPLKRLVDYTIPWIYYKLDRDEVDAWLQELYIEGCQSDDITKTKTYLMLKDVISDYTTIKNWYSTDDAYFTKQGTKAYIDKAIRRIDEPTAYFKLCDSNLSYLLKKMKRVIGRWYEERDMASGSFRHYAHNEVPQKSPFIDKKPQGRYGSLRDKIMKFLKKR